jgi:hypothetical protein
MTLKDRNLLRGFCEIKRIWFELMVGQGHAAQGPEVNPCAGVLSDTLCTSPYREE